MLFEYFLIIIALVWLVFASIVDIKKREVPDWLSYSLIAIGLGSRAIYSLIINAYSYFLFGLLGFAIALIFGCLMYYTKQWGGGDAKLLMGLGAMFGNFEFNIFNSLNKLPFLATLIINILIAGIIYTIIYSMFLGMKNKHKILPILKKKDFKGLKVTAVIVFALIILVLFLFDKPFSSTISLLLLSLLFAVFLLSLMKVIEDASLYKMIEVNKLIEGDWLVSDIYKNNKLICRARNTGIMKSDMINLKENRIKKVLIKEGIPFVPSFLIGFIISIVFGDILLLLV